MIEIQKHEDTGWIKLNDNVSYRVLNGVCHINVTVENHLLNTWILIGTMPSWARPTTQIYAPLCENDPGLKSGMVYLSNSGNIQTFVGSNNMHIGSFSYPIG